MDHNRFDDIDNEDLKSHIKKTDQEASETSEDTKDTKLDKNKDGFWSRFEKDDFESDHEDDQAEEVPDQADSDDDWDGDVWDDFSDGSEDLPKEAQASDIENLKSKIIPFWKKGAIEGDEEVLLDEQDENAWEDGEESQNKADITGFFQRIIPENIREHKTAVMIGAVVLIVVLVVLWLTFRTFHDYKVISSADRKASYYFREDGTVTYSKDGISFENPTGEVEWDQVLDLTSPKLMACEDYFAVGDIDENTIVVFNGQGMQGQITLEKPLVDFVVSRQGVVAAILADDSMNHINMYDKSGKRLVAINATIATTGYPLAAAISPDGTRLVVSYAVFGGDRLKNQVIFYDFSNASNSSTPAAIMTSSQLIPKVAFIDNQTVLTCGENSFMTYQFNETVTEVNSQQFDQTVRSLFVTNDSIGIITRNTKEPKKEGESVDRYVLTLYYLTGGQYASFTFDDDYKTVTASEKEMILCSDRKCVMYTFSGHKKFEYTFDEEIISLTPAMVSGRYILINNENVQVISLR